MGSLSLSSPLARALSLSEMRGEVSDAGEAVAKTGLQRAGLLPTTGIWHRLPRHTHVLMDDAMAHVDEDRSAASKFALAYEQARSAPTIAAPTTTATATATVTASASAAPLGAGAPQSTKKMNAGHKKLDKKAAIEIFKAREMGMRSNLSITLAHRYGLTAKAVRDIWNGRTWAEVTKPLCNARELKAREARRKSDREHPTPNPNPIPPGMAGPALDSLWWPRADRCTTCTTVGNIHNITITALPLPHDVRLPGFRGRCLFETEKRLVGGSEFCKVWSAGGH